LGTPPQRQDSTPWSVRGYYRYAAGTALRDATRRILELAKETLTVGLLIIFVSVLVPWFILPLLLDWPAPDNTVSAGFYALIYTVIAVAIFFVLFFVIEFIRMPARKLNEDADVAAQRLAEEQTDGDRRVHDARSEERQRADAAINSERERADAAITEVQRQLADWTMERDSTITQVAAGYNTRLTTLEMDLAARNDDLKAARVEMSQIATERDAALARLREIEEARPLLRLEPETTRHTSANGAILGYEAGIRLVNDRPWVLVQGAYAQIVEWTVLTLKDGAEMVREGWDAPTFKDAPLRIAGEQPREFRKSTTFTVATFDDEVGMGYFALENDGLSGRHPLSITPYAVRIEAGCANDGVEPLTAWFRLTFVPIGHQRSPKLEPWHEPSVTRAGG
jgi:hypothetical protein